ncbi:MAG: signal peptidase II [Lachnospiraceae bacterium]|nr:signal peptidase II [Lachnospiraceae bacterium]
MKKIGRILVPLVSVLLIAGLDQLVKYLTIQYLSDGREVKILGDALVLTYVQNRGMAWGLFQNGQVVFVILTPIAIAAVIFLYVRTPWEIEYRPIRIAEVMLVGGALGNLIDRIFRYDPVDGSLFHGYVVDMIYIKAIHFPVFNVADIFVTLSFVAMMLLLLFVYNDEEFNKCFGNFPPKKKVTEGSEEEAGESEDESEEPEKTEESEELPDDTAADGQEINHENN